jgi:hypothetical protein
VTTSVTPPKNFARSATFKREASTASLGLMAKSRPLLVSWTLLLGGACASPGLASPPDTRATVPQSPEASPSTKVEPVGNPVATSQNPAASSTLWPTAVTQSPKSTASWPVHTSLKATLQEWAHLQRWPAPQFLTQADWPVDVPGSIAGTIEDALRALAEGFAKAPVRPRIEVSSNHVLLVSEVGAE